jgi:hypothetical protein
LNFEFSICIYGWRTRHGLYEVGHIYSLHAGIHDASQRPHVPLVVLVAVIASFLLMASFILSLLDLIFLSHLDIIVLKLYHHLPLV